jgi:hypothetical protein
LILGVLAAFCAGAEPGRAADWAQAKAVLSTLASAAPAAVWPGFDPARFSLLLIEPSDGSALMLGQAAIEADWDAESGGLWSGKLAAPLGLTSPTIDASGRPIALVAAEKILGLPSDQMTAVLVHEIFHAFWVDRGLPNAEELEVGSLPRPSADELATIRLEGRALAAALAADERRTADLARAFLALRQRRRQLTPEPRMSVAEDWERYEGLAEYAGLVTAWRLSGIPLAPDSWRERLGSLAPAPFGLDREQSALLGGALALLLDRLRADWKEAWLTQPSQPLTAMLTTPSDSSGRFADLDGILTELGHSQVLAEEQARLERELRDVEARSAPLRSPESTTLVLRLPGPDARGLVRGWDPSRRIPLADGTAFHDGALQLQADGFRLETERPVLEADGYWVILLEPFPTSFRIRGVEVGREPPPARSGAVAMQGRQLELEAARGHLQLDGKRWILVVE